MDSFIKVFLSLSISGTLLIIILLLLNPLYKNKLSKKWQYYIWLAVIIRLLIPFTTKTDVINEIFKYQNIKSFQINISDNLPILKNIMPENNDKNLPASSKIISNTEALNTETSNKKSSDYENVNVETNPTAITTVPLYKKILIFISQNIFFIWLTVAVSLFIRKITEYQNFIRYLKTSQTEIDNFMLLEQLGSLIEKSHIKTNIALYSNNLISSPLLIGFFKPCIMFPSNNIYDMDFQYTIQHELMHYKRKDMFYKWLLQFTICLHWFNPFVYIMGHEINRLCELSCDEAVIKNLSDKGKFDYGETLLNAVNTKKAFKSSISSVTLNEGTKLLKERLDFIMKFKKKTKFYAAACFVFASMLTIILCVTSTALGNTLIKDNSRLENTQINKSIKQAKSASDNADNYNIIDKYIKNNKVILDDGIYYILYGDATKKDMPSGGVTNGCIDITLVEKDEYAGFGPYGLDELDILVDDIKASCSKWVKSQKKANQKKYQKKADVIISLAIKLQENNGKIKGLKDISTIKDYEKWGIQIKNGNYYYDNKRVRILLEFKANGDFKNLNYDKKGSIDLKLILNKKGKIKKVVPLSEKEAEKEAEKYMS